MYLIVGLGNPGKHYEETRHNAGFGVISYLSKEYHCSKVKEQCNGLTATFQIDGKKVMLVEPMTYMNNSGKCIECLARYYDIPNERIIVIFDDVDLPVGDVRVRPKGGPGNHNGIKSVIEHLGGENFPRIRIGIGPRYEDTDMLTFVLSRFPKDEQKLIDEATERAARAAVLIVTDGIDNAMNKINQRHKNA